MPIRERIEALKGALMEKMEGQESVRLPRKSNSATRGQLDEARAAQLGDSSSRLEASDIGSVVQDEGGGGGSEASRMLSRLERKIEKIEKLSRKENVNFQHKHNSIEHGVRGLKSARQQASQEGAEETDVQKEKLVAMIEAMKTEREDSFRQLQAYIHQRHEAMKQHIHRNLMEQSEPAKAQERFGMGGRDWKEQIDLHDSAMSYSENLIMLALQQKMDMLRIELLREKTIWQKTIEQVQDAMSGMVLSLALVLHSDLDEKVTSLKDELRAEQEERKRIQTELLMVLKSHCTKVVEKEHETKEKEANTDHQMLQKKGSRKGGEKKS